MSRNFRKIIISLFVLGAAQVAFCADISFESDVQVKKNSQPNFDSLKAGQSIELKPGDNIFVMHPQNIPMLIYSVQKDSSKLTIADTNFSAAVQEQLQPNLEKSTNEIIDGLRKVEALVQKRDLNQASTLILNLKEKYKNISSILFMSGTISFLLNNKNAAVADLEKGLRVEPNNEPAKRLLAKLKGTP